ncbi:MAG: FHA domain-containing protein [Anaerolineales bacterium]
MSATIVLALRLILALTLYAFLGWALWTMWRDLHARGGLLAARKIPGLTVTGGVAHLPPRSWFFSQAEIVIGRDQHCDIVLPDETVSQRHARLSYHHAQWWLEDLGSTNGTRLNGQALNTPTVIIHDDEIECGKACLTIRLGNNPANPPTQKISTVENVE